MKVTELRTCLEKHNYLEDKTIPISKVKTGVKYWFICDKGHRFDSTISNVFQRGEFSCPVCSGRRTLKGFNDLWTTHPQIAKMLKNPEDGYKYSFGSNVLLFWKCPDCGEEYHIAPNKMCQRLHLCPSCDTTGSYSERFVANLLDQFSIVYERERIFDWSENKRYDFYIPQYDCIIETHGKQHYSEYGFGKLGGRNLYEEQWNDDDKKQYAQKSGHISNYIVIDCRKSSPKWIKKGIIESGLLEVLCILPYTVDWEECLSYAAGNIVKDICKTYERGVNIPNLCDIFHLSKNSVRSKLKQGARVGWCSYDPMVAQSENRRRSGERVIATMSKPVVQMGMDGSFIKEFPSVQQAQREVGPHIWECIKGYRVSANGYKWRYKDEFTGNPNSEI